MKAYISKEIADACKIGTTLIVQAGGGEQGVVRVTGLYRRRDFLERVMVSRGRYHYWFRVTAEDVPEKCLTVLRIAKMSDLS